MPAVLNKTMRWHWDGKDYILEVPVALSDALFFEAVEWAFPKHKDRVLSLPHGDKRAEGTLILNVMEAWLCREFEYQRMKGKVSRAAITRMMLGDPELRPMAELLGKHGVVQRISQTSNGIGKRADVVIYGGI